MAEQKTYTVNITEKAESMLEGHIRFIAKINKEAAHAKRQDIMNAIRSLKQMPQRVPYIDDGSVEYDKYHKMYVPKWYVVIYHILDDTVYVDYIVDCRQDYNWLLQ